MEMDVLEETTNNSTLVWGDGEKSQVWGKGEELSHKLGADQVCHGEEGVIQGQKQMHKVAQSGTAELEIEDKGATEYGIEEETVASVEGDTDEEGRQEEGNREDTEGEGNLYKKGQGVQQGRGSSTTAIEPTQGVRTSKRGMRDGIPMSKLAEQRKKELNLDNPGTMWALWKTRNDFVFNDNIMAAPVVVVHKTAAFLSQWKLLLKPEEVGKVDVLIRNLEQGS
ncbi:unnamed protein product [Urochloa humidicola]